MHIVIQRAGAFAVASFVAAAHRTRSHVRAHARDERGQAVTEYVLLLLGVAAIALAVTAWAARSGKIGELLDRVFDEIGSRVA
jgi:Flp pilus assembly pilin Flp